MSVSRYEVEVADLGAVLARLNFLVRAESLPDGVTVAQARTLATLRDGGGQRIGDLAALEGVAQPSMSALVARLERRGWIARQPNEHDARVVTVALTEDGRILLDSIVGRRTQILHGYIDGLPEAARTALLGAVPALFLLLAQAARVVDLPVEEVCTVLTTGRVGKYPA